MALVDALVPVLVPVLATILVGVAWARWGRPVDPDRLTPLILNVGTPCLVFSTLSTLVVPALELGIMVLATLLMIGAFLVTGRLLVRLTALPAGVFLPPVVFGNLGNLGLPLNLFAFGDAGLELALIMFATQSVLFFTVHFWLMSGRASPGMFAKTPHVYAIAVALAFTLSGTAPPIWLTNTTDLIGGLTIPMLLIMLGTSLARFRVSAIVRPLVLALLRIVAGLGVAWALIAVLGLEGTARGVMVICCVMPGAVFNYLAAVRYNRSSDEVAGYVVVSTLAVLCLLPVIIPLAWWMAGTVP